MVLQAPVQTLLILSWGFGSKLIDSSNQKIYYYFVLHSTTAPGETHAPQKVSPQPHHARTR